MKFLLVAVSFLVAILAPGLAVADATLASGDAWTVYATANGQALQAIFEAIKGITQDDSYFYLITFVSLLAFIGYAVMATFDAKKIEGFLGVLVVIVVVTQVGLRQKADVVVIDPFYGTTYVSQDVPAGVAIPIAVISTVGQNITEMLETYFSTPTSLQVSNTGTINMASSLISDASRMSIQDSGLRGSLNNFSKDCIVPSIASGRLSGSMLTESPQLFGAAGTLKAVNPGIITTVYASSGGSSYPLKVYCGPDHDGDEAVTATHDNFYGQSVSADNAYEYISEMIEVGAPRALAEGRGVAYGTPAYTWLTGALSSAQTHLSDNVLTSSGEDSVRQAAAANMLTDGLSTAVASSGDSALTSSVAFAQAVKGQESSWVMAAQIFNDISGYIFSLLQALMIGLMPVIIVAAFVPGTKMKILTSVLQIFLWLALWQPTFAILNFIITEYAQGPFGGIINDNNYSMMTAPIVAQTTDRFMAAAGFMGASIPMITWGIVKGGMALTSFVSGALGGSFANAAANMAATGNVSLGNQSYDNYSANSQNFAGRIESGTPTATTNVSALGGATTNVDGAVTKSNLVSQEAARSAQEQQKFQQQQTAQLQTQVQSSIGDAKTVADATVGAHQVSRGENGQYQMQTSNGETYSESEMVEKMLQSGQSKNSTETVEEQQERATQVGISAGMSANGGNIAKAVGSFMKSGKYAGLSGEDQDQIAALKAGLDMGNTLRGKDSESASAQIAEGVTSSYTDRDGNQKQVTTSASEVYQGVLSNAETFSTTDSTTSQDTADAKRNVGDAYSKSQQIEESIEQSMTETMQQKRSAMPGITGAVGLINQNDPSRINLDRYSGNMARNAEQGRQDLQRDAHENGLNEDAIRQDAGGRLDERQPVQSGAATAETVAQGQSNVEERTAAGKESVEQDAEARQHQHEKRSTEKNRTRRAMAGDVQDEVSEKKDRIGEDANGGLLNIDDRFKDDNALLGAIGGMFGSAVGVNAAQGVAEGAAAKKAGDVAGDKLDPDSDGDGKGKTTSGDGPDGTKTKVSADAPDSKQSLSQKARAFVAEIGDKVTPDSVKKFQGSIDRMEADDTKSFDKLTDDPKFRKFAKEAGVDKAMDSIGKKLAVAGGAQAVPVGGQIVGGLMVAGAAYDAYETFNMMSDVMDQYSRNGADGVDYDGIKQQHMGESAEPSNASTGGSGRSFPDGGRIGGDNRSVFQQDGRANVAAGNSLNPDRTPTQAQAIIDQMDAGSQEFERTHLANDPNSTLLNTGESGKTVLEEIRNGDLSAEDAASRYNISPGAINDIAAPIDRER